MWSAYVNYQPVASKKAPPPPEVEDKEECARTRAFKVKPMTDQPHK